MKKKLIRLSMTFGVMMSMMFALQITASATAPGIEDIEYKGRGRIEIDFYGDVQYSKAKVIVKDTSGKKYKVTRVRKDNDDIKFKVKNIKRGKTYKISIKGVKMIGTPDFGTAKTKIKIPKAAKGKRISASKAVSKAKKNASKKWGAGGFWDVDVERDRYAGQAVWEVSFNGTINGAPYEFEYEITRKGGKILKSRHEYDD